MNLLAYIQSQPWLILPEMLGVIEDICLREGEGPLVVAAKLGRPLDNTHTVEIRDGVAIIPVHGVISRRMSMFSSISGGTSVEALAEDITSASNSGLVKAILMDFDTPGGAAAGIGELSRMMRLASAKKPVWGCVGSQCASGGYWMASACDRIVMASEAAVGSIGCVISETDDTEAQSKRGIKKHVVISKQSPLKWASASTESGRGKLQEQADRMAGMFISAVAEYRGVTPEQVMSDFGQGGMLFADDAVQVGMADEIDDFESTLAKLSAAADQPRRSSVSLTGLAVESPNEGATMSTGSTAALTAEQATELQKQLADLKKANATLVAQGLSTKVEAFLDKYLHVEHRLTPVMVTALKPLATLIATDDSLLAMQDGSTRFAVLEAFVQALPSTNVGKQNIGGNSADEAETKAALAKVGAKTLDPDPADNGKGAPKPYTEAERKSVLADAMPELFGASANGNGAAK